MSGVLRSKLGIIKRKTRKYVENAIFKFVDFAKKMIPPFRLPCLPSAQQMLKIQRHQKADLARGSSSIRPTPHRSTPMRRLKFASRNNSLPRQFKRLFQPISRGSSGEPSLLHYSSHRSPPRLLTPDRYNRSPSSSLRSSAFLASRRPPMSPIFESSEDVTELGHTPMEFGDGCDNTSQHWLLLQNNGNDCFLNAALQYMRRVRQLGRALKIRRAPIKEEEENKEHVLRILTKLLSKGGVVNPSPFREALPTVIKSLEPDFLTTQQDAYEILMKIFDDVIPGDVSKQFSIESTRRRRCRNDSSCKGCQQTDFGAIHYQHIGRQNEIIDLETLLSSEWTEVNGENELRHCSACCECCTAAVKGHDEEQCKDCKADNRPYVEEQRFSFKGSSNYALVAFNILHASERVDWALADNSDLDGMKLMGLHWQAVSLIKHIGLAMTECSHYVCYTRESDGQWWIHDDDAVPFCIGSRYRHRSGHRYPPGVTDMAGVVAILFEQIQ